jgi:mannose-6-phosphate isomerase-like protein (cupin superfamily)
MDPRVLGPDEGELLGDTPKRKAIIKAGSDELALIFFRYGPGVRGPDIHVHRHHTDAFYVIEGELTFDLGDRTITGGAGTFLLAPPMVPHSFRNDGSAPGRFLNFHAPSMNFHRELVARRDGRERDEQFDQWPVPEEGTRPASDGLVSTGGVASTQLSLNETALTPDPVSVDSSRACAYWVLDGELTVSGVVARTDEFVSVAPGTPHTIAGPARVISIHA